MSTIEELRERVKKLESDTLAALLSVREALKVAQEDRDKWKARAEWLVADAVLMERQNVEHTDALQAKLSAIEAQEPVAWRYEDARGFFRYCKHKPNIDMAKEYAILNPLPLYLAAPVAPAQPTERPVYGKPGTRDVDAAKVMQQWDDAQKAAVQPVNAELFEFEKLMAAFHAAVWEGATREPKPEDYDMAGVDEAKAVIAWVRSALNQPPKFKCGVDLADGVLTVTVIQAADDGVMEVIHSETREQVEKVLKVLEYTEDMYCVNGVSEAIEIMRRILASKGVL